MEPATARRMWLLGEPLHAVTYFAPESFEAWAGAGLRGFWRGYFATRAAPLGAVGPEPVEATFFNFAPDMVARALPAVWDLVSPAEALRARSEGAVAALRRILGSGAVVDEASELVRGAAAGCDVAGRALFAANLALPWPDEPLAALWHGLTLLREHRGDGHNAALVAAGLDGLDAHVLAAAVEAGGAGRSIRQEARGWTDGEWDASVARLLRRGTVTFDGRVTDAGRALHEEIESRTDRAGMRPWEHLGPQRTLALAALLRPWAEAVVASGVVRFPNPMGLPPADAVS